MGIVFASELFKGRGGETADGVREYTRVWRIQTSSPFDTAADILGDPAAPKEGDVYFDDAFAYCNRVVPINESTAGVWWILTATYSTEREASDNPLNDPPQISWDTEQFQKVLTEGELEDPDNPGTFGPKGAVVNTAGDPFDPPIMRDDSRLSATIVSNVTTVPISLLTLSDVVNDADVIIDGVTFPARTIKINRPSLSIWKYRNDIAYRELRTVCQVRSNTWDFRPLSEGFREVADTPTERTNIKTPESETLAAPVLLDKDGKAIDNPTPSSGHFMRYKGYDEDDLSVLPGITAAP